MLFYVLQWYYKQNIKMIVLKKIGEAAEAFVLCCTRFHLLFLKIIFWLCQQKYKTAPLQVT